MADMLTHHDRWTRTTDTRHNTKGANMAAHVTDRFRSPLRLMAPLADAHATAPYDLDVPEFGVEAAIERELDDAWRAALAAWAADSTPH